MRRNVRRLNREIGNQTAILVSGKSPADPANFEIPALSLPLTYQPQIPAERKASLTSPQLLEQAASEAVRAVEGLSSAPVSAHVSDAEDDASAAKFASSPLRGVPSSSLRDFDVEHAIGASTEGGQMSSMSLPPTSERKKKGTVRKAVNLAGE